MLFPKRNWVIGDVFLDAWTSAVGYTKNGSLELQSRVEDNALSSNGFPLSSRLATGCKKKKQSKLTA